MEKQFSSSFGKDKDGVKYQYPQRTCKDCIKYPCFRGQERMTCDYAKYGCRKYEDKTYDRV